MFFFCVFPLSPLITCLLGALFGAYYEIEGGTVSSAMGIAFDFTGRQFSFLGQAMAHLVPSSTVFYILGGLISFLGGFYFALFAAVGAFVGSAIAWIVIDVLSGILAGH
jgi:glycerol uptake facilitator-like aquaporin